MKYSLLTTAMLMACALTVGCHHSHFGKRSVGCADGSCGVSAACEDGSCGPVAATAGGNASHPQGALLNYEPNGGHYGKFGVLHGQFHQGPQSHTGAMPGPAAGPAQPTVTYPYYTTRGPRDFLNPNPPSIGP